MDAPKFSPGLMQAVMTGVIKHVNTPKMDQLNRSQVSLLTDLIENSGNILSNYAPGQNKKLDKELTSIGVALGLMEGKKESGLFDNFMKDIGKLNHQILNPQAPLRQYITPDLNEILPKNKIDPSFNFNDLPPDTQKAFQALLWAHTDLARQKAPASFDPFGKGPQFLALVKASADLKGQALPPTVAAYIQSINDHLYKQHMGGFHFILTPDKLLEMQNLPPSTKQIMTGLFRDHQILHQRYGLTEPDPKDPVLHSFIENYGMIHPDADDNDLDKKTTQFLSSLSSYLFFFGKINTQRAFLPFLKDTDTAQVRQKNKNQSEVDATQDPTLTIEHEWAKQGYSRPFDQLNLWENATLSVSPKNDEHFNLLISTQINDKSAEQTERRVTIPIQLTSFRPNPEIPLTSEQKDILFKVLSNDSSYSQDTEKEVLPLLNFLSKEQITLLFNTHAIMQNDVNAALLYAYKR